MAKEKGVGTKNMVYTKSKGKATVKAPKGYKTKTVKGKKYGNVVLS